MWFCDRRYRLGIEVTNDEKIPENHKTALCFPFKLQKVVKSPITFPLHKRIIQQNPPRSSST